MTPEIMRTLNPISCKQNDWMNFCRNYSNFFPSLKRISVFPHFLTINAQISSFFPHNSADFPQFLPSFLSFWPKFLSFFIIFLPLFLYFPSFFLILLPIFPVFLPISLIFLSFSQNFCRLPWISSVFHKFLLFSHITLYEFLFQKQTKCAIWMKKSVLCQFAFVFSKKTVFKRTDWPHLR